MPKSVTIVAADIKSRARGLDLYLKRMEELYIINALSRTDVERAYAGGFLEFHVYLERSIERLFLGLLRGRLQSADPAVKALIKVNSDVVASNVVSGERTYAEWLPYKRYTLRRAKSFFSSGRPFTVLNNTDIDAFEDASIIRNALAHQSSFALRQFKKKFIEGRAIPPIQQRPQPFLRGFHAIDQTRLNYLLSRVVIVMGKLCQ